MLLEVSFRRDYGEIDLSYMNGYNYRTISNLLEQGPSPHTCVVVGISLLSFQHLD